MTRGDNGLSRLEGGIGGRGPGEQKLEIDRRRVRDRIRALERQLGAEGRRREQRRSRRRERDVPVVSLVGYTNAGKSTLLNLLTRSEVFVERKMFATLDPTSRRLRLPREREIVINDTVGFIRDLPADLMKKMYAYVSAALREYILSTGIDIDESLIDGILAEGQTWTDPDQKEDLLTAAERFIGRKEQLHQLNTSLLLKLMREGKILEFVAGIARLCKLDFKTARQTINDKSGEKLAIVCRALEIDNKTFSELVGLTDPDGSRNDTDKAELIGVYGRITAESAQRAMRFLRTRQKIKKEEEKEMEWGA